MQQIHLIENAKQSVKPPLEEEIKVKKIKKVPSSKSKPKVFVLTKANPKNRNLPLVANREFSRNKKQKEKEMDIKVKRDSS